MEMLEAVSQTLLLQGYPGIPAPGLPPLGGLQILQNGPRPPKCVNLPQMVTSPPKRSQISKCCKAPGWFHSPQNAAIPPINSKLSRWLQPQKKRFNPPKGCNPPG